MRSTPPALLVCVLAAAACQDLTNKPSPYVLLNPVLDSLFVGDQSPPPVVTYYDGKGGSFNPTPSQVTWSSADTTISINSATGRITGLKRGTAIITADVQGTPGIALIVVSNTLDLTLLADTIYLMPGDTFTVPRAVQKKNSPPDPPPVISYEAPSNAVYSMDPASGLITALAAGGPVQYIVHADTIAARGGVYVVADTGGKFFFSVLGTAITHVGGGIRGVNYTRSNGKLAFRLRGIYPWSGTTQQVVQITLPDSILGPGPYPIDSLGPAEAAIGFGQPAAICAPPRPWALWSAQSPAITAFSRQDAGELDITRLDTVASGVRISGRFLYLAQRTDLYSDPLGILTVRGTFVAPLVTDRTNCQ